MTAPPPSPQAVSWNGLQIAKPRSWDAIVRDDRHLIFEHDLRPVLEVRWELPGNNRYDHKQGEKIIARMQKEADRTLIPADTPRSLTGLTGLYHIQCFKHPSSSTTECALLTCKGCTTPILMRFYAGFFLQAANGQNVISSFSCCRPDESNGWWSIQDIRFRLPGGFSLDSYSFRFGLSRLSFASKTSHLTLCRLAPASQHLKNNSFQQLFASFSHSAPGEQEIIDDATLQYARLPGLAGHLFSRLRRRKSFLFARFSHHCQQDRITGFLLESSRPIRPDTLQTIQDSYGIIQQETAGDRIHP